MYRIHCKESERTHTHRELINIYIKWTDPCSPHYFFYSIQSHSTPPMCEYSFFLMYMQRIWMYTHTHRELINIYINWTDPFSPYYFLYSIQSYHAIHTTTLKEHFSCKVYSLRACSTTDMCSIHPFLGHNYFLLQCFVVVTKMLLHHVIAVEQNDGTEQVQFGLHKLSRHMCAQNSKKKGMEYGSSGKNNRRRNKKERIWLKYQRDNNRKGKNTPLTEMGRVRGVGLPKVASHCGVYTHLQIGKKMQNWGATAPCYSVLFCPMVVSCALKGTKTRMLCGFLVA